MNLRKMNIIINGSTSFTGLHLILRLLKEDNNIYIVSNNNLKKLLPEQLILHEKIKKSSKVKFISIDSYEKDNMINDFECIKNIKIDAIIVHGYMASNYKAKNYDFIQSSLNSIKWVFKLMELNIINSETRLFYTGTYFQNLKSQFLSSYALSKSITWSILKSQLPLKSKHHFLFPNPFGYGEEKRLCYSLLSNWFQDRDFELDSPNLIRDNIPIKFLIDEYYLYINNSFENNQIGNYEFSPSYYISSNLDFINFIKLKVQEKFPSLRCVIKIPQNNLFKSDVITGETIIRDKYINQEDQFWDDYLNKVSLRL